MKKVFLFLICIMFMPMIVFASEATDAGFESEELFSCVLRTLGGSRTTASDEELATITSLNCSNAGITSTKGIEKLSSLIYLVMPNNNITNIDLSNNPNIRELFLQNNKLTSVNLINNTRLVFLNLEKNDLEAIDLTRNTQLHDVNLSYNKLNSIDLSQNSQVTKLQIAYNELENIDLSRNININTLKLNNNNLTNITFSNVSNLTEVNIAHNKLEDLMVGMNAIKNLSIDYDLFESLDYILYPNLKNVHLSYHDEIIIKGATSIMEDVITNLPEVILNSDYMVTIGDVTCTKTECNTSSIIRDNMLNITASNLSFDDEHLSDVTIDLEGEAEIMYVVPMLLRAMPLDNDLSNNNQENFLVSVLTDNEEDKSSDTKLLASKENDIVSSETVKSNPETGAFLPSLSLILIGGISMLIISKTRKSKIIKIG